jgi:hypothetical protein
MMESIYTPAAQLRVLKVIESQCPENGQRPVLISIDGMTSDEISSSCRILSELGLITAVKWDDKNGPTYFPVRITAEGKKSLLKRDDSFWECSEKIFEQALKHWTGVEIDISNVIGFFQEAKRKHEQERV